MGPLELNEIISGNWSLVIMLFIGIAFGIVLEQAGFSSTRRLVGIFYGYDFVVLKVFFTAGVTAMVGLIFMSYFGWIDSSMIYVNSNHLWSAIAGGVIMGFGFVIGGYCPGTSVCAAAIGKIDAMFFILGIILGIFVYGLNFPFFNQFFTGYYFDGELIFNTIGIGRGWFVFMMVAMAIIAFNVGKYFEKKANYGVKPIYEKFRSYKLESAFLLILAALTIFIPEKKSNTFSEIKEQQILSDIQANSHYVNSDEVAFNIINKDKNTLKLIDVRTPKEFQEFHLPGSINIQINQLLAKSNQMEFENQHTRTVFISNGEELASKAWMICRRNGMNNLYILKGGLNAFVSEIFYPVKPDSTEYKLDVLSSYRFKINAINFFQNNTNIESENKNSSKAIQVKMVKSAGGC